MPVWFLPVLQAHNDARLLIIWIPSNNSLDCKYDWISERAIKDDLGVGKWFHQKSILWTAFPIGCWLKERKYWVESFCVNHFSLKSVSVWRTPRWTWPWTSVCWSESRNQTGFTFFLGWVGPWSASPCPSPLPPSWSTSAFTSRFRDQNCFFRHYYQ